MKKYFEGIKTLEELKKAYKKLALKLHPDMNRDKDTTEEFKQMQNEYEDLFNKVKNKRVYEGKEYEKETKETPEEYRDIIDHLIFCDGVTIEIIGTWIWLTGNTYTYRELIKELNFKYSKNKKSWYYNGEDNSTYRRGHFTLEQLRQRFETTEVETQKRELLSC